MREKLLILERGNHRKTVRKKSRKSSASLCLCLILHSNAPSIPVLPLHLWWLAKPGVLSSPFLSPIGWLHPLQLQTQRGMLMSYSLITPSFSYKFSNDCASMKIQVFCSSSSVDFAWTISSFNSCMSRQMASHSAKFMLHFILCVFYINPLPFWLRVYLSRFCCSLIVLLLPVFLSIKGWLRFKFNPHKLLLSHSTSCLLIFFAPFLFMSDSPSFKRDGSPPKTGHSSHPNPLAGSNPDNHPPSSHSLPRHSSGITPPASNVTQLDHDHSSPPLPTQHKPSPHPIPSQGTDKPRNSLEVVAPELLEEEVLLYRSTVLFGKV